MIDIIGVAPIIVVLDAKLKWLRVLLMEWKWPNSHMTCIYVGITGPTWLSSWSWKMSRVQNGLRNQLHDHQTHTESSRMGIWKKSRFFCYSSILIFTTNLLFSQVLHVLQVLHRNSILVAYKAPSSFKWIVTKKIEEFQRFIFSTMKMTENVTFFHTLTNSYCFLWRKTQRNEWIKYTETRDVVEIVRIFRKITHS